VDGSEFSLETEYVLVDADLSSVTVNSSGIYLCLLPVVQVGHETQDAVLQEAVGIEQG
jgi:hypothetical protein